MLVFNFSHLRKVNSLKLNTLQASFLTFLNRHFRKNAIFQKHKLKEYAICIKDKSKVGFWLATLTRRVFFNPSGLIVELYLICHIEGSEATRYPQNMGYLLKIFLSTVEMTTILKNETTN